LIAQWEKLPCGAEPRIELGPALQQANALPTEPRRTITEPRRTITEPCRTMTEPRRTITEPRRTITEPRRTILTNNIIRDGLSQKTISRYCPSKKAHAKVVQRSRLKYVRPNLIQIFISGAI
jgi:hypothetical protein